MRSKSSNAKSRTKTCAEQGTQAQVLSELRGILRSGGRLMYLEHGQAPDRGVAKWQRRIKPVWKRIAGSCHLTRPVGEAVKGAGFQLESIGATCQNCPAEPDGWNGGSGSQRAISLVATCGRSGCRFCHRHEQRARSRTRGDRITIAPPRTGPSLSTSPALAGSS